MSAPAPAPAALSQADRVDELAWLLAGGTVIEQAISRAGFTSLYGAAHAARREGRPDVARRVEHEVALNKAWAR